MEAFWLFLQWHRLISSHRFDADLEMESNCEKLGADRALFAITTDRFGGAYTQ